MLHNYFVHQEAVPFENYSGQNVYIANNPNTNVEFYNTHKLEKDFVEPYFFTLSDLSLSEKGGILKDRVIDYMLSEPFITIERLISRALLFFQGINTLRYHNDSFIYHWSSICFHSFTRKKRSYSHSTLSDLGLYCIKLYWIACRWAKVSGADHSYLFNF